MVQFCAKPFRPEPWAVRFCCAPPGHTTDHIVIYLGEPLRYPVTTTTEENS